jgi:hypothetical protein
MDKPIYISQDEYEETTHYQLERAIETEDYETIHSINAEMGVYPCLFCGSYVNHCEYCESDVQQEEEGNLYRVDPQLGNVPFCLLG